MSLLIITHYSGFGRVMQKTPLYPPRSRGGCLDLGHGIQVFGDMVYTFSMTRVGHVNIQVPPWGNLDVD